MPSPAWAKARRSCSSTPTAARPQPLTCGTSMTRSPRPCRLPASSRSSRKAVRSSTTPAAATACPARARQLRGPVRPRWTLSGRTRSRRWRISCCWPCLRPRPSACRASRTCSRRSPVRLRPRRRERCSPCRWRPPSRPSEARRRPRRPGSTRCSRRAWPSTTTSSPRPATSAAWASASSTRKPAHSPTRRYGGRRAARSSWRPIDTGGGASIIYPRPSWQQGVDPGYGNHRLVPDTAWNAAVNGGVDVYITAYPQFTCGNPPGCWTFFGGPSAATPQTAALVALVNAARAAQGKQPIGFLDPLLYSGVGATAYTDIVPQHYGSAPKTFAGAEGGGSGTEFKSGGDLQDNQLWEVPVAGYPTTTGYDANTGWGTPSAPAFVSALAAMP